MLTTSVDRERSGLRSGTSGVTEQQANALASGDGNLPGERGTSQTVPGEESGRSRVGTGVNTLSTTNAGG